MRPTEFQIFRNCIQNKQPKNNRTSFFIIFDKKQVVPTVVILFNY